MHGARIVHGRFDLAGGELRDKAGAILHINHELVIDAFVARMIHWHLNAPACEQPAILARNFLASCGSGIQMAELDAQHGALQSVHAVVIADEFVFIACGLAVRAGCPGKIGNLVVIRS
jgi:hypothetical protein